MSAIASVATESAPKGVVLFDGECPFCRKSIAMVRKLDWLGRLEYQNCRDLEHIPANTAGLSPERMIEEIHKQHDWEDDATRPGPSVKVFFPWKAMLVGSLVLTVLINLIGWIAR